MAVRLQVGVRAQGVSGRATASGRQFVGKSPHSAFLIPPSAFRLPPSAFTLTELLIVIAIISVLAGLIAAAAVNALRAANRGQISLEIKQISASIEEFKNEYGAYPPNGMHPDSPSATPAPGTPAAMVRSDFIRMFKKAFPRHQEPPRLINALCGTHSGASEENLLNGMSASESLAFWLGGFSEDTQFPISGPGGPSFDNESDEGEVLENRNRQYEFDLGRLTPRNDLGVFDEDNGGRFVRYEVDLNNNGDADDPGEQRRINLWRYLPKGSEQPLVYFDTSRYKPGSSGQGRYDLWAANPDDNNGVWIVAFKQLREGRSAAEEVSDIVFVNQGKFQILHAGLDDDWDSERMEAMSVAANGVDAMLYPEGPFLGAIADTLTNFTDGAVEDATQE